MSKVWRVAKNEYLNIIRTKAFIISIVLMPVLMGGAIAIQALLGDKVDLSDRRFAVVDETGRLFDGLKRAADRRNTGEIFRTRDGERDQLQPRFRPEAASQDPAQLSARVRSGDLFAYVVVGEGVIAGEGEIAYHTGTPTYQDLPNWLRGALNAEIRRLRFAEHDLSQELVRQLTRPARWGQYGLVEVTEAGEVKEAEKVNQLATFGVPAGAMWLLFMLVMMATPALLNNVLEEKMQRIAEILVSSVSPFELFLGKLLGTVFVSWTLAVLYLGGITYVLLYFGVADVVPVSLYFWLLFWQLMALLIFGSIFSGIGAACSEMRDAQAMMGPAMLILILPMFVWFIVLRQPDSPFAVGISLFPPATPFLMLLRLAVPPGPALWEISLAILLTVAFTLACVWAASRIFRIGVLAQGQAPSFRRLLSWVFSS
ncbi:MAG: ABC transporter permease [Planctomycetota bacterium]|jgi:ABC-2 type transport system permease protein